MSDVKTVTDALQRAVSMLGGRSDSPRLDAEILLATVLGLSRAGLIVRGTDGICASNLGAYDELVLRRLGGVPIAYLTGVREFWSLAIAVTPDVLVPRPETEVLVEQALERLPQDLVRSVLDLGTGSGAIALAIAHERPLARITGVDVSEKALTVAIGNDLTLRRASPRRASLRRASVAWRTGSWFDAVSAERFDMIVSNPPYVASDDPALLRLAAEPTLALSPGPTGLEALTVIVAGAARHLNPGGWLLLEHGNTQAGAVARLLEHHGFDGIRSHLDHAGNPRITLATVSSSH